MIFKKVEKVVGLQQPAGRDYLQSKQYSSKLLNQVSKVREILTRRNSTEIFDFETGPVSWYGDFLCF